MQSIESFCDEMDLDLSERQDLMAELESIDIDDEFTRDELEEAWAACKG